MQRKRILPPTYVLIAIVIMAVLHLLFPVTPFLVIPVFAILIDSVFIRVEEHMLEDKFGRAWLGYKRQVRRWI